jgi:hypothetical protein
MDMWAYAGGQVWEIEEEESTEQTEKYSERGEEHRTGSQNNSGRESQENIDNSGEQ